MNDHPADAIHTQIWQEEAEPDNAFGANAAFCHGYDVYRDMLGRASWADMQYLLLRGEAPDPRQASLLNALAVALANPGPRDPSVHAAMCGGVAGSTAAASLMAALAVGAGTYGGGREVLLAMQLWEHCGANLDQWQAALQARDDGGASIWPAEGHAPGFDPHGVRATGIVLDCLGKLAQLDGAGALTWLQEQRAALEAASGLPLAMAGVAACAMYTLGLSPAQGEMLYLLLRLPGAAAHALEQQAGGFRQFPFFRIELEAAQEGNSAS